MIPNEVEPPKEPLKEPLREPEPLGEPLDGENIPLEDIESSQFESSQFETSRFETGRFETSQFETSQFEKSTLKRKRSPVKSIENTTANKRERESSIQSKKSNTSSLDTSTSTIPSYKARLKELCCCGLATVLKYNFLLLPILISFFVRYLRTLFWDDITIIWDENIVTYLLRKKNVLDQ